MQKYIIAFLTILFIHACSSPLSVGNNDLKELNLKGKVKSVNELKFLASGSFGKVTKEESLPYSILLKFNEQGLLTKKEHTEPTYVYATTYEYDEQNQLIEELFTNKGGGTKVRYEYAEGYKISRALFDLDGNLKRKSEYKYEGTSKPVEQNTTGKDGAMIQTLKYFYDKDGNRIKMVSYNEQEIMDFMNESKYNEKGMVLEEIQYMNYGGDKPVIEYKQIYKYDEHDNPTNIELYDRDGELVEVTTNRYEYDREGNWIKKTVEKKGKYEIFERQIEYYDL